jgi:hypothetical protein
MQLRGGNFTTLLAVRVTNISLAVRGLMWKTHKFTPGVNDGDEDLHPENRKY